MKTTLQTRVKHSCTSLLGLIVVVLTLILTACSSGGQTAPSILTTDTASSNTQPVVALPGYHVSLFASGTSDYSHPDSVAVDNGHVFIDYQNITSKTGVY